MEGIVRMPTGLQDCQQKIRSASSDHDPLHDSEADTLFSVSINSHIAAPPLGSD